MTNPEMVLGTGTAVDEVLKAFDLTDGGREALSDSPDPRSFVERLVDEGLLADALAFMAHALPIRTGVYWAWTCAREAAGEEAGDDVRRGLATMRQWIGQPTDENRRLAFDTASALGVESPTGVVGTAIFLSGGSLGPPDQEVVEAAEGSAAKTVMAAVALSADRDPDALASFLSQGISVAEKAGLWGGSDHENTPPEH